MLTDKSKCSSMKVHKPSYDRTKLKHGIVHLSVGAFHRAHLAYYMDLLASEQNEINWGIVGVGIRMFDKPISDALQSQKGLYTLVSKGGNESDVDVRIIGSMIDYLFAPDSPEAVLDVLSHPDTKIASLTITESGYDLDINNAEIQHDLKNPQQPKTVFGFIVHALNRRKNAGIEPFTVMSCDNVQANGEVTKKCILSFVKALNNQDLLTYIQSKVTFPSAMVDRITPATTDSDRDYVLTKCGITDKWPVVTEPFVQWVIEDNFCNGRPPLEHLSSYNVLLTEHVEAYECMKMRLLNASHSSMCYLGYLMGYRYIHEIILDQDVKQYIEYLMNDEVSSTLPPVPGIDLELYKKTLITRFSNPNIKDTALRVCMDGASKFPKFLNPTIDQQLKSNQPKIHFSSLAIGAWIRYITGVDEENNPITLQDPLADQLNLKDIANNTKPNVKEILNINQVFGDLGKNEKFVKSVQDVVNLLYEKGSKATLKQWLNMYKSQ
ncbi:unnamed protein product [Didymodactylos carnosus]|nr:unnamed protein product [Didymodactylos carnosus]CAF3813593.1 unnamed protein product [Didymodactylos carnosus]